MSALTAFNSIMAAVINTAVGLTTHVIINYWPFILVIGLIAALIKKFSIMPKTGLEKDFYYQEALTLNKALRRLNAKNKAWAKKRGL